MLSWIEKIDRCKCLINELDELANGDNSKFLREVREDIVKENKFQIDKLLSCLEDMKSKFYIAGRNG